MTKFKFHKRFIWIPAIAGIFIILFVFTGFPFQFIPVDANETQKLLDEINNLADLFEIPFECEIVSECEDIFIDPPPPITDIVYDCDVIPIPNTDLFLQECPNIVFDPIENKTIIVDDDGTIEDPVIPPPEPVPLPPEPEPEPEPELFEVSIISEILKRDNAGNIFQSTTNFEIPLLAFFIEDTTNLDFDNGFIEQKLILNAQPNTQINLNGNFDVLIANQTILLQPITISISGVTDNGGNLEIDYVNVNGLKSKDYIFRIADHLNKFPVIGTEKIEYVLNDVKVTSGNFEFALESVVIYSLSIATDPNQLIIVDEEGGRTRVFPTDDTLRIYSTTSKIYIARSCTPRRSCSPAYYACCYVAPAMGGGKVTHILQDGSEIVLAEFNSNAVGGCRAVFKQGTTCDSFQKVNIKIQRDEIYRIDFTSPTKASITFKTPMEQKSYTFYCKGNSATATTGLGSCNFLSATLQKELADTLVNTNG